MVLGEAPGRLENHKGKPFIGPAGQKLRKALRTVELDPDAAYYLNAVSCWPHGTPEKEHVRQCHDNLKAQLDAVDEQIVLVCGRVALQAVLPHAVLTNAMGQFIPAWGKWFFPVYHPSYLLQNRDKTILADWFRHLEEFSGTVRMGGEPLPHRRCIYCGARTWEDWDYHCQVKDHVKWWKQDTTKWKRPVPPQMSLDLGV